MKQIHAESHPRVGYLKTDNVAKDMFDEAAIDVENELVKTSASGLVYFAEQKYGKIEHKMDHLACFGGES